MKTLDTPTIDFRKEQSYKAVPTPAIVEIPDMLFVMVDGTGAPENNPQFVRAMETLYGIVYTVKFWDKKFDAPPNYAKFSLTPLEALWWMQDGSMFDATKIGNWAWTVMIRLPDFVTPAYFQEVVNELTERKQKDIYKDARLEKFHEGTCAQLMHIGPYDQETANIKKLHAFARESGYKLVGKHHELYFSDPRRTAPEKLKTIIRQPVALNISTASSR